MAERREVPEDLVTDDGRRAFADAVRALEDDGRDADVHGEQIRRYARAADMAALLRSEWLEAGRPTTTLGGSGGKATVAHPLVVEISRASEVAQRAWRELLYPPRRGAVGRPTGATSAPDRAEPTRIRRVK